ncbi:transporter suffix domain-containing protein [Kurthia sibirica]|uniref:Transporter suffix domain-containing protein n=1 Tax=Kurthia sibirica TaxID=202750 RepID=A0A2U3ALB8_9BACL|nr:transporter suffix domain-containing protein [Kurthia sibirica]PWI25331.1 hypothetical protein DEX24_08295 [Kurthia sibirica]GEK34423.1 hypothetical protein KSI01_19560 [Kurthia sibirica]
METEPVIPTKKTILFKIGMVCIGLACLFWLIPIAIAFVSLTTAMKATAIASCFIIAEIFFWIGALLVGKELVTKFRSSLHPRNWRKKKKSDD